MTVRKWSEVAIKCVDKACECSDGEAKRNTLINVIAEALRQTRKEALEEAAVYLEDQARAHNEDGNDNSRDAACFYAMEIRSKQNGWGK